MSDAKPSDGGNQNGAGKLTGGGHSGHDPNAVQQVPTEVVHIGRPWLGVAVACVIAALILIFLVIPGILLFPQPTINDDRFVQAQREGNRALEERILELRRITERAVCVRGGTIFQTGADGLSLTPLEAALRPPAPPLDRLPAATEAMPPGGAPTSLVSLMDRATAFVVVPSADGEGLGTGTGFFIAPDLVVTNRHVIEKNNGEVFVINVTVGEPIRATVVASTPNSDIGSPDFALLKLPTARAAAFLTVAPGVERMQPVFAAGFPGLVTETDVGFRRLIDGDMSSAPEVSFTDGIVTARQSGAGADLLLHSAAISPGNSGGPLIDICGRVVGVNTFVRSEETYRRMNYALSHKSLTDFLKSAGVTPRTAAGPCAPDTAATLAPARPGPPPTPSPARE